MDGKAESVRQVRPRATVVVVAAAEAVAGLALAGAERTVRQAAFGAALRAHVPPSLRLDWTPS